jgi:glycosyltransferase involved in cell wall biosynthesis
MIPKKSICLCITNYKKEIFLDRAIRSCQSQLHYNFSIEIIVVNDGSKKFNKHKISKEFPEVKIIDYKKNKGVSYASNRALFVCKSDYFMRVDADDYIGAKSSMILTSILDDNPKIPFVYGDILLINKDFNAKKILRNKRELLLEHGAGIMFRTKHLKSINGYDINLKNCEDFDLIIKIEKKYGKGLYVPVAYYKYYKQSIHHLSNSKNRKFYLKNLRYKYAKYL